MRHSNPRRSKSNRSNGKRPYNNGQNRSFESNGAGAKLRGSAPQVFDKYIALAREAFSNGDRVSAENFFQHAEHYYRVQNLATSEKKSKEIEKVSNGDTSSQKISQEKESVSESPPAEETKDNKIIKDASEKEESPKPRLRKKKNSSNSKNSQQSEAEPIS